MTISCEAHAALAKRDCLFIHGNLASPTWWQPTARAWRALGSTGAERLLFSHWSKWSGPTTLEALAEAHLHFWDELAIKGPVDVVGHSLGGLIALQMMILRPERFHRAVLLDSVGAQGIKFDDGLYDLFRQMQEDPALTRQVILGTIQNGEHLDLSFKEEIGRDAYRAVCGIGHAILDILKTVDLREQIKRIGIPSLVLHGKRDAVILPEASEQLARLLPNATLELLPNQGHCWNVEEPRDFTKRVREWLT